MLTYNLTNIGSDSLYEYLYKCIKKDIILGNIKPGERLPSKRPFSKNLGVSIITVENAYSLLMSEGFIYSLPKKGFYVTDLKNIPSKKQMIKEKVILTSGHNHYLADFSSNQTESDIFPFTTWIKTMKEVLRDNQEELMINSPCGGIPELRKNIANFLKDFRDMNVKPEQIIIGAGTEYLYSLIIQLLGNDVKYGLENPGYPKTAQIYKSMNVDFEYVDMDKIQLKTGEGDEKPDEKVLDIPENIMDQIRLVSTYKGVHVPSMMFDSTGTKKIAAIASYVIEALEQGRILVVDELDSSIHFKLTRAIVAMFNNELNTSAQMIFTVHDINLMDCKRMFRKEQIWFVHKDEEGVYVYSLADFTAQQGVRDTTDVMEKYRKGALGALPDPELINSLISIKGDVKGDDADAK